MSKVVNRNRQAGRHMNHTFQGARQLIKALALPLARRCLSPTSGWATPIRASFQAHSSPVMIQHELVFEDYRRFAKQRVPEKLAFAASYPDWILCQCHLWSNPLRIVGTCITVTPLRRSPICNSLSGNYRLGVICILWTILDPVALPSL